MVSLPKNKELRKIEVKSVWKGKFQTENHVRNFQFLIDEPEKLGGGNEAPTPLEYVVGSFNGCILVVIEMAARELQFNYEDIQLASEAWVDRRGLAGQPGISPHFQEFTNTIYFKTNETPEALDHLKRIVMQRCPMYNLIKDTGIPVTLNWSIV